MHKKLIKPIIFSVFIIVASCMIFPFKSLLAEQKESDESISLSAVIYDTNSYGNGSDGIALTEDGVEIKGWNNATSKYLQIDPHVPVDDNTYVVTVEVPKELYYLKDEFVAPGGYTKVEFEKNDYPLINNSVNYDRIKTSGKLEYTMDAGTENASIQLELRYDEYLWDKKANSLLTEDGVSPVKVTLSKKNEDGSLEKLKEVLVSKATAGSALPGTSNYHQFFANGTQFTSAFTVGESEVIESRMGLVNQTYGTTYYYYPKMELKLQLPYYTSPDGTKYYIDVPQIVPTITSSAFYGSKYSYTTDDSLLKSEGIIIYKFENFMWKVGTLTSLKMKFPTAAKNDTVSSYTFKGGSYTATATGTNGITGITFFSQTLPNITFETVTTEEVTMGTLNSSVSINNRPSEALSLLGGINISNLGTGVSGTKNIHVEFDVDNTGKIKVVSFNAPTDNVQQKIPITYTLVDEDGSRVYLDNNGNKVSKDSTGAVGEWEYSLTNSYYNKSTTNAYTVFSRNLLPVNQRKYYLKSVDYKIQKIDQNTRLYASSGNRGATSGGNFHGYVSADAVSGDNIKNEVTLTSENSEIKILKSTPTTTFQSTNTPSYYITNAIMDKTSVIAGDSINVSGTIGETPYPYGNSGWLRQIRLGVVLPSHVSINESSIKFTDENKKTYTHTKMESKKIDGTDNVLWTIFLPEDKYIGYVSESLGKLSTGATIDFSFQLDTSIASNNATLFLRDMLYVAGEGQTNSSSGAYAWSSKVDIYDLNGNNSVSDKIAGFNPNNENSCIIQSKPAVLDVSDSIYLENEEESDNVTINNADDVVVYDLNITNLNGGYVDDFVYYIPIPKKSSPRDSKLIESPIDNSFELSLQNEAVISGSNIYTIMYTQDEYTSYDSLSNSKWYTKEEIESNDNLSWSKVTALKVVPNTNSGIIDNGKNTKISVYLKYDGEKYDAEAGAINIWHSAGNYRYINGNRETSGLFSTLGVTVNLNYNYKYNSNGIVLTAAKDMDPKTGVKEYTFGEEELPNFKFAHTFKIVSVTTNNVILKETNDILNNIDAPSNDANREFALTIKMKNGTEKNILDSANKTPIVVGTSNAGEKPSFTFKLYNSDNLTDNVTQRYLLVTLESDQGVRITQRITINRELALASDPESAIIVGKQFLSFDDKNKSVTISQNSSISAQFVTEFVPNMYGEHIIKFSNNLPVGTNIVLANVTNSDNPKYWYYNVSEATNLISLNDFYKMGTTQKGGYEYETGWSSISEKLIFVIDFSNTNMNVGTNNIEIMINPNSSNNGIDTLNSEPLTYVISNKRTFGITSDDNIEFEKNYTISYTTTEPSGEDTIYDGRKFSLIVSSNGDLPKDSYITLNNNRYYLNKNNEFILPLEDVQDGNGSLEITLNSNMLSKQAKKYSLTLNLWVSKTSNASSPKMGEVVASKSINLVSNEVPNPSLKITSMNGRLLETRQLTSPLTLDFDYINCNGCTVTIEMQQKIGSAYQTITDRLNQVNGSTIHDRGVFALNAVDGINRLNLRLANNTNVGTYRFLLKVTKDNKAILTIPYNFIIIPNEQ